MEHSLPGVQLIHSDVRFLCTVTSHLLTTTSTVCHSVVVAVRISSVRSNSNSIGADNTDLLGAEHARNRGITDESTMF